MTVAEEFLRIVKDHVEQADDAEVRSRMRAASHNPYGNIATEIADKFYGTTEKEGIAGIAGSEQGELFRFRLRRAGEQYTLDVKPVHRVQAFEDPVTGETIYLR